MSYRFRLFVTSSFIVSVVLAVVLVLGWTRMLQYEVRGLDSQLCYEAKQLISLNKQQASNSRFTSGMRKKLGLIGSHQFLMLLEGRDGKIKTLSSDWPEGLSFSRLVWSEPQPLVQTNGTTQSVNERETCQQTQFEIGDKKWRGSLYSRNNSRSFIAIDLQNTETELRAAMHSAMIVIVPLALVLCAISAWLISLITVRPITRLTAAMQSVNHHELSQRLPVTEQDDREFRVLIDTYNRMLERLERSFLQSSRFSADAAHELKTPLTILRGKLELAINHKGDQSVDLHSLLDEVGRLSSIVRKLLLLSQADAGTLSLNPTATSLSQSLNELLDDFSFDDNSHLFARDIEQDIKIYCDELLLAQLLNNILSNAVRYRVPNTTIHVTAKIEQQQVLVCVTNQCHRMSAPVRSLLFQRFYRVSSPCNQKVDGSGLGLSLSREIARAHSGDLCLLSSDEQEFKLQLRLPMNALRE